MVVVLDPVEVDQVAPCVGIIRAVLEYLFQQLEREIRVLLVPVLLEEYFQQAGHHLELLGLDQEALDALEKGYVLPGHGYELGPEAGHLLVFLVLDEALDRQLHVMDALLRLLVDDGEGELLRQLGVEPVDLQEALQHGDGFLVPSQALQADGHGAQRGA